MRIYTLKISHTNHSADPLAISLKPCFIDELYRDLSTSRPGTGAPSARVNAALRAAGLLFLIKRKNAHCSYDRVRRRSAVHAATRRLHRLTMCPLRVDEAWNVL